MYLSIVYWYTISEMLSIRWFFLKYLRDSSKPITRLTKPRYFGKALKNPTYPPWWFVNKGESAGAYIRGCCVLSTKQYRRCKDCQSNYDLKSWFTQEIKPPCRKSSDQLSRLWIVWRTIFTKDHWGNIGRVLPY